MESIVKRSDIKEDIYMEMFKTEGHHDHEIIDDDGIYRWKETPGVNAHLKNISLNDLIPLLITLGYDKNSEIYRKLYRDMGYSLYGYWEVFYWDFNNEKWDEYVPGLK